VIFLDANVFMYATGADGPYRDACITILEACAQDLVKSVTNTEVLQEILYRYGRAGERPLALRRAQQARAIVSGVLPVDDLDLRTAIDLMGQFGTLGVRDAIHAVTARRAECSGVVSADRGFDPLAAAWIRRLDPLDFAQTLEVPEGAGG